MNADIRVFLQGERQAEYLLEVLAKAGARLDQLRAILDFGCGPGRVIRQFQRLRELIPHTTIYGADINPEQIDWCRRNLRFAEFKLANALPPLTYDAQKFDFIYAFSVFTHLTELQQVAWMNELSRVLKPGGYLLITVHGESRFGELTQSERKQFRAGELVVRYGELAGSPSSYADCFACHPPGYVERRLARDFDLVRFVPVGALPPGPHGAMDQDQYFFRKPIGGSTRQTCVRT